MATDNLAAQLAKAVQSGVEAASDELVAKLAAAMETVVVAPRDRTEEKATQSAVNYRPRSPEGGGRCGGCVYFETDGRCRIVRGTIDPDYVCDRYEPRMKVVERTQIPKVG